jgi:choline dehydrogenase
LWQFIWMGGNGTLVLALVLLKSGVRGTSNIQSDDPLMVSLTNDPPVNDADIALYLEAVDLYIKPIVAQLASVATLVDPSPEILSDPDALTDYIMQTVDHAHHWTGLCSMGKSIETGVVDGNGRVFGVKGLIVADDSILPTNPNGNTTAPAMFVASTIAKTL